jgi:SAM-dependent methyltransferase
LILNTIGAFIGALLCHPKDWLTRFLRRVSRDCAVNGRVEAFSPSTEVPANGSSASFVAADLAQGYDPKPGQRGKDVEWVPASPLVISRMFDIAKITSEDYVIDLGSGDGHMAISAAKIGAKALGIEFNPHLVELSRKNAAKEGVSDRVTFVHADFFETDFSEATVLALFLREDINLALRPKILEMAPGTRIVSNIFHMGEWKADEVIKVEDENYYFKNHTVYYWVVPAKVAGTWRIPLGELELEQNFQVISGTLKSGGIAAHVSGKMTGDRLDFVADGIKYTGSVNLHAHPAHLVIVSLS